MKTLADIATELAAPFPIADVELLPKGSFEQNSKTMCMALPYADPRVYQDRLNQLAYGEWSTPPPIALVAGDKLICYVTVTLCGVSHTDVGEAPVSSENAGTEAYAQAFKRSCSQFGLGRYLYNLEKQWVAYDPKKKRIDLDADGIQATVWRMYQKAGLVAARAPQQTNDVRTLPERPPTPPQVSQGNGHATTRASGQEPASVSPVVLPTVQELQARCEALYGVGKWEDAKRKLGINRSDEALTDGDLAKIAKALRNAETKAAQRKQASAA